MNLSNYLKLAFPPKKFPKSKLYGDSAIEDIQGNELGDGLEKFVEKIHTIIKKNCFSSAYSIGINSQWGDGKTSSLNILKGSSYELLDMLLAFGGSSAGARPKIMAQIDKNSNIIHGSQKLQEDFEHYIIKFPNSTDGANIGKIEYIYSLIAKKANIEIPDTKLLQTKKGSYFAIKRFDRIKDNRLHIHSVAGLTHSDFRIPSLDYDDLLTLCFHLTKDINEVKKLFRLAVFNLFTHNRDDHAKNFSFMLDEKNSWKLTPAYDLTFSYGVGTEHSTTYLNEGKNPNINHLEKLAKNH